MDIELAVPLPISQIEAANRLHRQLSEWKITDGALQRSRHAWFTYPGSDAG